MKTHTTLGFQELDSCIARGAAIDPLAARVAHEHHEKFHGKGYPRGLKGRLEENPDNGIHVYSRIVTIADIYSALLMKRVYKPAYDSQDAIKIMAEQREDFDPEIFVQFLKGVVQSLNREAKENQSHGRILEFDGSGRLTEMKRKAG